MSFRTHPYEQIIQDSLLTRQQILFKTTTEVEAVDSKGFPNQLQGLVHSSEMTENDSFQMAAAQVMPVPEQGFIYFIQSIFPISFRSGQLGQRIITGILPGSIPTGFIEIVVGLIRLTLIFQRQPEIIQRLAVIRVRILFCQCLDSTTQIRFGFCKLPLADQPQSHCVIVADIIRITAERLFIIVGCGIGCMTILLKMQAGQIKLFRRLDILRIKSCFCWFGYFLYLIGFRFPR